MRLATTLHRLGAALLVLCSVALADGYRPDSPLETQFIDGLEGAQVAVFPTIIRDPYTVDYSTTSQQRVVDYFDKHELAQTQSNDRLFELAAVEHRPQFELFMDSLTKIGKQVAAGELAADYALVLEVIFPPSAGGRDQVFGIHVFILTPEGENAFSFLLNSHHDAFNRAALHSMDTSKAGREKLVLKSTTTALGVLKNEIKRMQACPGPEGLPISWTNGTAVVDDFTSALPAGTDGNGIEVGFSTFSGDNSKAWMSITTEHPERPGEASDNQVLKVDLDVNTWAGVLHRFTNESADQWIAYDWRGAKELSFWFYGTGSGTTLLIEFLDNRHRCSNRDDAERYSYEFADTVSGWQLMVIPFEVMTRKEIGNGAPHDGPGLSSVHGWGLAVLKTHGPATFYVDDVRIHDMRVLESTPAGEFRDTYIWSPTNELPMYGGFEKTAWQKQADDKFLATMISKYDGDREVAAERFAQMGWNLYNQGNKSSAIKRFNQAWLLHPDNQYALWGFAVIARERGNLPEALQYYELALAAGPDQDALREEYEQLQVIGAALEN